MNKTLLTVLAFLVFSLIPSLNTVQGQQTYVAWEQIAVDSAEAQSYTYKLYLNNSATPTATLSSIVCGPSSVTTEFTCAAPYNLPNGNITIQLTASNAEGESTKSLPYSYKGRPHSPSNLRVKK